MRMTIVILGLAVLVTPAAWGQQPAATDWKALLSDDQKVLEQGAAQLRQEGPAALDRLLAARKQLQESLSQVRDKAAEAELKQAAQLDRLIDLVGGQRYCTASRLFWYTDLDQARKVARDTGKPILSLRMMGRLTDEYSCANSRFFRTTLYANETISQILRERYVLHWKSVRPVPKVTIDFGDGRVLERTLTGNSIHYVLDEQGRVLDGLPGLYSPQKFEAWLKEMQQLSAQLRDRNKSGGDAAFEQAMKFMHTRKVANLAAAWQADLDRIQGQDAQDAINKVAQPNGGPNGRAAAPPANEAARIAVGKGKVEMPIIQNILPRVAQLELATTEALWEKIAALHAPEVQLDKASLALIRDQNPTALAAGRLAVTKRDVEDPLVKMVAKLHTSIAVDTVRNEYELHRRLHEWLASGTASQDVEPLNDKVYAELFLTPRTDPWIGLVPADVYTGLPNNGVTPAKAP